MRYRAVALLIGITVGASGCVAEFFSCTSDSQCSSVVGGRCEYTGFCSAVDPACTSGHRYDKDSSPALSGTCVVLPVDLGSADQNVALVADQAMSRDFCVGSQTDPNNCGGCGVVCLSGQYCNHGSCGCPASIPDFCTADLDNFCTNEQTDIDNCGACGNVCPPGQLCQSGACVETCASTPILYTSCVTYCANEQNDPNHCGGCNNVCSQNNILAPCNSGECNGTCVPGFSDCNNNKQTDGCEIDTSNDVNNCGACAHPCTVDINSTNVECTSASCSQTCNAGYANCGPNCCAQNVLELLAGRLGGPGDLDGTGSSARFNEPQGIAVDGSGNVYVADATNSIIRKITASGVVSTLAGSAGNYGSADGTGSAARFDYPFGVAVDGSDNLYVADTNNSTVRKITASGMVSTFAGSAGNFGYADGTGSAAQFFGPQGVAIDRSSNIYVADSGHSTIRKITANGVVTTLAGVAGGFGSTDGSGSTARFHDPIGVAVDGSGNIYIGDQHNQNIRKITASGVVSTLAGSTGNFGYADGTGSAAQFFNPQGVAVDGSGNVYVADVVNQTIREITPSGVVSTLAGNAGTVGIADGLGSAASFYYPTGVAIDSSGNVYVTDTDFTIIGRFGGNNIRKITPTGLVSTLAGARASEGTMDGTGTAAQFYGPSGVAVDGSGNVYVADAYNQTIRKVTTSGVVSTLAGSAGGPGTADGSGSMAQFNGPVDVAVDGSDNVYVVDMYNNIIRKITASGVVSTLAGSPGNYGSADGTGSAARFDYPFGVAVDGSDNLYVADTNNSTVRKITASGMVSTLAGDAGNYANADGTGSAAQFNRPHGVALDSGGNVYVADTTNSTIRKITTSGVVSTLAGSAGIVGTADGVGSAAQFNYPQGVAVDGSGNIYVADSGNSTIRKIAPNGVVTTVVGVPSKIGDALGVLPATLNGPTGVAVFGNTLIIATPSENAILRATKVGGF